MSEESQAPVVETSEPLELNVKAGTNEPPRTQEAAPPAQADLLSRIPEQYREAGYWKNVKSEEDLFTQFAELQKYRGQSIKVPGEHDDQSAWDSIYGKLGRPSDPEGYDVKLRDYDEQITWAEGSDEWLKNTAFELGLNTKQTQALADKYGELILQNYTDYQKQRNSSLETLKGEYGDLYERKVTLGERAMQKIGGDELVSHLKALNLDTDPLMVKAMIRVGQIFEESNFIDGRVGAMGKGEAKAKLDSIRSDTKHAYWDNTNPDHDRAVQEVMNLEDIVYGG